MRVRLVRSTLPKNIFYFVPIACIRHRIFKENTPVYSTPKSYYRNYISIASGVALLISETLPFTDSKFNGIFHTLHVVLEDYLK